MKLPTLNLQRWFAPAQPTLALASPGGNDRFGTMHFSSRSGGDDYGFPDDDDPTRIAESVDEPSRTPRTGGGGGGGRGNGTGGRQRTIQFQPEDRYWTEYLRIALPIIGLILMLGLFWYWATQIIGDDPETNDPVSTEPGAAETVDVATTEPTPTETQAVQNTPQPTEETAAQPTEEVEEGGDAQPTDEPAGEEEPTEESAEEEPTEEESSGGGDFAADDVVTVTEEGDGVRLRSEATTDSDEITQLSAGEELVIQEGPEEADGYQWYYVVVTSTSEEGWVASDFIELAE